MLNLEPVAVQTVLKFLRASEDLVALALNTCEDTTNLRPRNIKKGDISTIETSLHGLKIDTQKLNSVEKC
jgi:hypothetical protein